MGAFTKRWVIRKRRTRKQKIDKLRRRYRSAESDTLRTALVQKALQVSPQMSAEDFLGPIQKETGEAKKSAKR